MDIDVEMIEANQRREEPLSASTSMWARNGLYVDVSLIDDGSLRFMGQDLKTFGDDEYEYALTVAPDDIPKVTAALGAKPGDDVISLLVANAEKIIRTGERTWLQSLGIEPDFWSRIGP